MATIDNYNEYYITRTFNIMRIIKVITHQDVIIIAIIAITHQAMLIIAITHQGDMSDSYNHC